MNQLKNLLELEYRYLWGIPADDILASPFYEIRLKKLIELYSVILNSAIDLKRKPDLYQNWQNLKPLLIESQNSIGGMF